MQFTHGIPKIELEFWCVNQNRLFSFLFCHGLLHSYTRMVFYFIRFHFPGWNGWDFFHDSFCGWRLYAWLELQDIRTHKFKIENWWFHRKPIGSIYNKIRFTFGKLMLSPVNNNLIRTQILSNNKHTFDARSVCLFLKRFATCGNRLNCMLI